MFAKQAWILSIWFWVAAAWNWQLGGVPRTGHRLIVVVHFIHHWKWRHITNCHQKKWTNGNKFRQDWDHTIQHLRREIRMEEGGNEYGEEEVKLSLKFNRFILKLFQYSRSAPSFKCFQISYISDRWLFGKLFLKQSM